jgi:hypothetical protein
LRDGQGLDVVQIDAALPGAEDRLNALCPDVVIFDLDGPYAYLILSFVRDHPGLPLVGLGLTNTDVVVLSSQQYTALSAADLAQVIKIINKDEARVLA